MSRYFVLILIFAAFSGFADPEKFITGTVNVKGELNVRVKPGKQYFIVSNLKNGDSVKIFRKVDDWYEITAPSDSSVWVAGHLMFNSRTRREANLRAGPGNEYKEYRMEPAGVELEIIKGKNHNGWFKIKPPVDLKAWVSSRFVTVNDYELKELQASQVKRNLVLIDQETGDFAGFLKDKDAKPAFILPFIKGSEREIDLKGQIVPLKPGAVYVTHALININNRADIRTAAYLHCRNASLNVWRGKTVCITGTQKLVHGWKLPVVEIKTVVPEKQNTEKDKPER
ncbi:MAG: SH3 domain-containing protein [Victivallales bacterium]